MRREQRSRCERPECLADLSRGQREYCHFATPLLVIFFAVVALLGVPAALAASADPAVESAFPLPLDH